MKVPFREEMKVSLRGGVPISSQRSVQIAMSESQRPPIPSRRPALISALLAAPADSRSRIKAGIRESVRSAGLSSADHSVGSLPRQRRWVAAGAADLLLLPRPEKPT